MLVDPEADYLSGKWAEKESMSYRYSFLICLFYLAVILVITGAAVLSVQLLGDGEKKMRQDRLLWQLGVKEREIDALNRRQLLMLFAFPAVPAAGGQQHFDRYGRKADESQWTVPFSGCGMDPAMRDHCLDFVRGFVWNLLCGGVR